MLDIGAHNCVRARVRKVVAQRFIKFLFSRDHYIYTALSLAHWVEPRRFELVRTLPQYPSTRVLGSLGYQGTWVPAYPRVTTTRVPGHPSDPNTRVLGYQRTRPRSLGTRVLGSPSTCVPGYSGTGVPGYSCTGVPSNTQSNRVPVHRGYSSHRFLGYSGHSGTRVTRVLGSLGHMKII